MNWHTDISAEIETFFDIGQQIPEEEVQRRGIATVEAYHSLFLELSKELNLKDTWTEAFAHIFPFSTGIIERSDKLNCEFTFGVSIYGYFMELPIWPSHQIRHMSDEFWQLIGDLSTLGKAKLEDHGKPGGWGNDPEEKHLIKCNNSLLFSIARDYILLERGKDDHGCSVGDIRITLPLDTPAGAVRDFYKQGLKKSHRMNYLLHRSWYLQRKKMERRIHQRAQQDAAANP